MQGYGGIFESDAVIVPGLSHGKQRIQLLYPWKCSHIEQRSSWTGMVRYRWLKRRLRPLGDNSGPYTAEQYVEHFYQIQLEFPDAQVRFAIK